MKIRKYVLQNYERRFPSYSKERSKRPGNRRNVGFDTVKFFKIYELIPSSGCGSELNPGYFVWEGEGVG